MTPCNQALKTRPFLPLLLILKFPQHSGNGPSYRWRRERTRLGTNRKLEDVVRRAAGGPPRPNSQGPSDDLHLGTGSELDGNQILLPLVPSAEFRFLSIYSTSSLCSSCAPDNGIEFAGYRVDFRASAVGKTNKDGLSEDDEVAPDL
ncbi:hypothetical protein BDN67DRAFT_985339 [Paxillus ammoniavirescens]|nr:hypothetical protein BDN67DRAFT_985339 [Paxillus ammoniavirescens]